MNEKKVDGIRQFRGRLAEIRDGVLRTVTNPEGYAKMQNIPESELGAIIDLTDEQRASVAEVVAKSLDIAFRSFMYGLDRKPVGLEIGYQGQQLNSESEMTLSTDEVPPVEKFSGFGSTGSPKT